MVNNYYNSEPFTQLKKFRNEAPKCGYLVGGKSFINEVPNLHSIESDEVPDISPQKRPINHERTKSRNINYLQLHQSTEEDDLILAQINRTFDQNESLSKHK